MRLLLTAAIGSTLLPSAVAGAPNTDLKTAIFDVKSVTVMSGRYAEADGLILATEARDDGAARSITVTDVKMVKLAIDNKPATRAETIAWVADQRWPRVGVTTERKTGAVVELRFYGCPPESRAKRVEPRP